MCCLRKYFVASMQFLKPNGMNYIYHLIYLKVSFHEVRLS